MNQTIRIDTAEVAKIVRAELKKHFPAVKFSVHSSRYAGGSSIDVGWIDGPTVKAVEAVAGDYHGATFDGMIDLKEYHKSEYQGQQVYFRNDYIFFNRDLSDKVLEDAVNWYNSTWAESEGCCEFVPTRQDGKWTHPAYIKASYEVERRIYQHLGELSL